MLKICYCCLRTVTARGHVNGRGPAARLGGMSAKREVSRQQ